MEKTASVFLALGCKVHKWLGLGVDDSESLMAELVGGSPRHVVSRMVKSRGFRVDRQEIEI